MLGIRLWRALNGVREPEDEIVSRLIFKKQRFGGSQKRTRVIEVVYMHT